jgi:Domain of unknown function (DUF222)
MRGGSRSQPRGENGTALLPTQSGLRCSRGGGERLVRIGGVGTPDVAEFAPAELGAVLGTSPESAASLIGDALDLRHRLPAVWARARSGEVKAWVGRRVAQVTRSSSFEAAAIVDRRVAPFAHSLVVSRLEKVAEAAIIEADPAAAEKAAGAARDGQGVWLAEEPVNGYHDIFIRTDAASAMQFDHPHCVVHSHTPRLSAAGQPACAATRPVRDVAAAAGQPSILGSRRAREHLKDSVRDV